MSSFTQVLLEEGVEVELPARPGGFPHQPKRRHSGGTDPQEPAFVHDSIPFRGVAGSQRQRVSFRPFPVFD